MLLLRKKTLRSSDGRGRHRNVADVKVLFSNLRAEIIGPSVGLAPCRLSGISDPRFAVGGRRQW
jgi:hypothetical protein